MLDAAQNGAGDEMVIDITLDHALTFGSLIVGGAFTLWMRSVSAHNKLSEQSSAALQKDINEVKKDFEEIQKQNDSLRDCLQETRENYVTNARFEAFVSEMKSDLKAILAKLSEKHDKSDCRDCRLVLGRRAGDKHDD